MKKLVLFFAAFIFTCNVSVAHAACTQEDAQKKAMQFTTQVQTLAQKDAARAQKLMQEFAADSQKLQTMKDMDAVCKYYDDMIEKMK